MTRLRRQLGAAVLIASTMVACAWETDAGGGPQAASPSPAIPTAQPNVQATEALPRCPRFPEPIPFPEWVPDDLPLPKPIYAYQRVAKQGGFEGAYFVLKGTTTVELTKLVLREWPKAGYTLGRGDAEPGEVEDDFHKPPAVGAFKANDIYCRPLHSIMYLIWAPKGPTGKLFLPTPTSRGTPLKS
jgi:hypothetical protein